MLSETDNLCLTLHDVIIHQYKIKKTQQIR